MSSLLDIESLKPEVIQALSYYYYASDIRMSTLHFTGAFE